MLDQMLFLGGHDKTDDITPIDLEAFVNSRVNEAVVKAVKRYGHHTQDCVVLMRFRSDDGTRCDCGYRTIVGGDDGEPDIDGWYSKAYCINPGCEKTGRSPEDWFVCSEHVEDNKGMALIIAAKAERRMKMDSGEHV